MHNKNIMKLQRYMKRGVFMTENVKQRLKKFNIKEIIGILALAVTFIICIKTDSLIAYIPTMLIAGLIESLSKDEIDTLKNSILDTAKSTEFENYLKIKKLLTNILIAVLIINIWLSEYIDVYLNSVFGTNIFYARPVLIALLIIHTIYNMCKINKIFK